MLYKNENKNYACRREEPICCFFLSLGASTPRVISRGSSPETDNLSEGEEELHERESMMTESLVCKPHLFARPIDFSRSIFHALLADPMSKLAIISNVLEVRHLRMRERVLEKNFSFHSAPVIIE